eukprot:5665669-Pleurochrysis_carterae.AAC.1
MHYPFMVRLFRVSSSKQGDRSDLSFVKQEDRELGQRYKSKQKSRKLLAFGRRDFSVSTPLHRAPAAEDALGSHTHRTTHYEFARSAMERSGRG